MIRSLSGAGGELKMRDPEAQCLGRVFSPSVTHKKLNRCEKKQRLSRGFTLIELLVVIAVIALLLAILMPALRKAKQIAQRVSCRSNLKQIGLASNMYLDDHDGHFYQKVNANVNYGGWKGDVADSPRPLNPFLSLPEDVNTPNGAKVFLCPADRGGVPNFAVYTKVYIHQGNSYITNFFLIGQDACAPFSSKTAPLDNEISKRLPKLNRERVDYPSRLLLMGDYGWWEEFDPGGSVKQEFKELAEWHGRAECHNMVFLDGHAAFVEIQKGYYVADEYSVLPFKDLYSLALSVQGP